MPLQPPNGGGSEYPDGEYEVLSQETTVQLLGATDVQDVQQVTARALPSNVVFPIRLPVNEFTASNTSYLLKRFAGYFNTLSTLPHVGGVTTFQDIDAAGQIVDLMQVTVLSTSGRSSSSLVEASLGRSLDLMGPEIDAMAATLDAVEAGG